MHEIGLDDLVILVINDKGHQGYADDLEDYTLSVLQDTEEADVFGQWSARGYDVFIVDRLGFVETALPDTFPIEEHDLLVEELSALP